MQVPEIPPQQVRLQYQIPSILRIIDTTASMAVRGETPSQLIEAGNGQRVKSYCGSFSTPVSARDIGKATHRDIRAVVSNHEKPIRTHTFMEDRDTGEIIDPVAITFLNIPEDVAKRHTNTLHGTMFIGTRDQLQALVLDPEVTMTNCSTAKDKELSLLRIWGTKGKLTGVEEAQADAFYSQ